MRLLDILTAEQTPEIGIYHEFYGHFHGQINNHALNLVVPHLWTEAICAEFPRWRSMMERLKLNFDLGREKAVQLPLW